MDLIGYLISWLSYRVVAVCLASVPLTHIYGLYCRRPPSWRPQHLVLFPLTGGNRHIIFQLLAWGIWALSALAVLPVLSPSNVVPLVPRSHVDVISGAAAACSFIGELFMLKAILVYDGPEEKGSPRHRIGNSLLSSSEAASALVMFMGLLASITGGLLLACLEYMPDIPSRVLYCCLSLSCLLIGSSTTYGLGGFLRFVKARPLDVTDAPSQAGWQFFQPFAGGTAFVATQAVGWSLFSATIVCVIVLLQHVVMGVAYCLRCWAVAVGILMILAQLTLGVSLFTYQQRQSAARLIHKPHTAVVALQQLAGRHLPVLLMYLPVHTFFLAYTLSFTFLPLRAAATAWIALLVPYYVITSRGNPQHTGCRRWEWLCNWFEQNVEGSLRFYFGELKVIRDSTPLPLKVASATTATTTTTTLNADSTQPPATAPIPTNPSTTTTTSDGSPAAPPAAPPASDPGKYIFAFQPHGYYPTGAGFLPMMPTFKRLFPGVTPVTLTASVMYLAPAIKDICCWAGFRQVSRKTFVNALNTKGAVVMCPGGQAEMVHTYRAFRATNTELVLHVRHKGFLRIAVEEQASVVPVLALGELLQLRNAIDAPTLQQYTYRRFGFPFPYLMTGRWGFSPIPRKVPLHYILADPLPPPPHTKGQDIDPAALDAYHAQYVEVLKGLFERHKESHPVLKDAKLVLAMD